MTKGQMFLICAVLLLSVVFLLLPFLVWGVQWRLQKKDPEYKRRSGISKMLLVSACLIGSVWCLRYAVGYYGILFPEDADKTLTCFEEVFNSLLHALQTFSMDEDYTTYITDGRKMLSAIFGADTHWDTVYGVYASVLNFIAPVAGGAIVFDILASIFPGIKLHLSYVAGWKEKYFFSELNEASLALAESVLHREKSLLKKPTVIFTDAYTDDEVEKSSELFRHAKQFGAICVKQDLAHVPKNKYGKRKFFLIDEKESGNLQTLTKFADKYNSRFLHNAQIYLFTQDDAYVQVERRFCEKLQNQYGFTLDTLPDFIPIQRYRNMITNLLTELPLYEPLIQKRRENRKLELSVAILGTGAIGREMFLTTYWIGQMLDCRLQIRVVSQESEEGFWNQIDYINPEIRHTAKRNDPILQYNRKGDCSDPYCEVKYTCCDARSSEFISLLQDKNGLANTDYVFVALGSDEDNMSVANTVRSHIGQYHLEKNVSQQTVIAYVVYDPALSDILNTQKAFSHHKNGKNDIYMQAVGNVRDLYSEEIVMLKKHEEQAQKMQLAYLDIKNRAPDAEALKTRVENNDDYEYWANLSRALHLKYRIFSMGLFNYSVFETGDSKSPAYRDAAEQAYQTYLRMLRTPADEKQMELLHRMAWLEHRRWNAFTRVKGFRCTTHCETYAIAGRRGAHKQMELKLHPCLVECDEKGIRAALGADGKVVENTRFKSIRESAPDLLDELTVQLYEKGIIGYDFKQFDYPADDLK